MDGCTAFNAMIESTDMIARVLALAISALFSVSFVQEIVTAQRYYIGNSTLNLQDTFQSILSMIVILVLTSYSKSIALGLNSVLSNAFGGGNCQFDSITIEGLKFAWSAVSNFAIRIMVGGVITLSVVYIIYLLVKAQGSVLSYAPGQIGETFQKISYALIGLIMAILATTISNAIISFL